MNKVFENVSEAAFACLGQKLKDQGLELDGDAGYLSKNGVSLDYTYDGSSNKLSIENLEVGFPASLVGMNNEKVINILDEAIQDCQK